MEMERFSFIFRRKWLKMFVVRMKNAIFAIATNEHIIITNMAEHNELGKWGEQMAAAYLERNGYQICERDWRMDRRDLDIIAMTENGQVLVIVEVKTRRNDYFAQPEQAVTRSKMRSLSIAANAYVKMKCWMQEVRFDIISVIGTKGHVVSINHIVDAFNPMLVL